VPQFNEKEGVCDKMSPGGSKQNLEKPLYFAFLCPLDHLLNQVREWLKTLS
jgi:hypothetical protein